MENHLAIIIALIVIYFSKALLGEGKVNTAISVVIGICVGLVLRFFV